MSSRTLRTNFLTPLLTPHRAFNSRSTRLWLIVAIGPEGSFEEGTPAGVLGRRPQGLGDMLTEGGARQTLGQGEWLRQVCPPTLTLGDHGVERLDSLDRVAGLSHPFGQAAEGAGDTNDQAKIPLE